VVLAVRPQRYRGTSLITTCTGTPVHTSARTLPPPHHAPQPPPPHPAPYRGTSLTRKRIPLGPYRRPMSGVLGWSKGDWRFLVREVPLAVTVLYVPYSLWASQRSLRAGQSWSEVFVFHQLKDTGWGSEGGGGVEREREVARTGSDTSRNRHTAVERTRHK